VFQLESVPRPARKSALRTPRLPRSFGAMFSAVLAEHAQRQAAIREENGACFALCARLRRVRVLQQRRARR
jgi:hypothetical protein